MKIRVVEDESPQKDYREVVEEEVPIGNVLEKVSELFLELANSYWAVERCLDEQNA